MGQIRAEVFRVAARRIQLGQNKYCCNAIHAAVQEVYSKERHERRYLREQDHMNAFIRDFGCLRMDGSYSIRMEGRHAFWNKPPTPKRQLKRVETLLKLASKYESGIKPLAV